MGEYLLESYPLSINVCARFSGSVTLNERFFSVRDVVNRVDSNFATTG
jgi:hypothetical protein